MIEFDASSGEIAARLGPADPREIGPFPIIGLLGAGGMGEVFLGTAEGGRYVAVKRARPRVSAERFQREVGILYRIPHGVAPAVLASDGVAARPWFATDYVPGLTVHEALDLSGPFSADCLWLLLAETAAQLQTVHDLGIVHRDLKPANVMLVRDGVRLIDFGVALAADQSRFTVFGQGAAGTHGFIAPELQRRDELADVAASADLYSLGALLLYAAAKRHSGGVLDPAPLRSLDAELADIIEPCIAEDPDARPTAAELAESARKHLATTSTVDAAGEAAWPAEAMARIAVRRKFAETRVNKLATFEPPVGTPEPPVKPTPPKPPEKPQPQPEPQPQPPDQQKPRESPNPQETPKPGDRRRWRVALLPAAAVALVGGLTAFVIVPFVSPYRPAPDSPATGTRTMRPTDSTRPTTSTAKPTRSASPAPSATSSPTTTTTVTETSFIPTSPATTSPPHPAPPVYEQGSGPSGDANYVSGSYVTVPGCGGWMDNTYILYSLLSAGNATCSANVIVTNSDIGNDGTSSLQAANNSVKNDEPPSFFWMGTYQFTMQVCIWNDAASSTKACSAVFTDNNATVSKG